MKPAPIYAVYGLLLIIGILLSLVLAAISWRRRSAPGARALTVLHLGAAWWMLWYVVPLPISGESEQVFFRFRMIFPGVVIITPAMLVFVLQYTGHKINTSWRTVLPFLIEPLVVLAGISWPALTDLFFGSWRGRLEDGHFRGAPLFWAHTVYCYSMFFVAIGLLIRHYVQASSLYRRQVQILILGTSVSLLSNFVTLLGFLPTRLDLSPVGLVFAGSLMAMAIFKRGLLDLIPVARAKIMEVMSDGVLILDLKWRVVDSNPAAQEILGLAGVAIEERHLKEELPQWNEAVATMRGSESDTMVLRTRQGKFVDLRAISLKDAKGAVSGKMIVLRDVTEAKLTSDALQHANQQLHVHLLEIESMQEQLRQQAIRDALTGLFNRRYLEDTLQRELHQAQRTGNALAVVMMDIDHFKKINDTYGHAAGDATLRALGTLLLQKSRSGDAACRYGGEEFVVILSGATLEYAAQRAQQWRTEFAAMRFEFNGVEAHFTVSAGVAVYPDHGSDEASLLSAADSALYAAKAAGRNAVCVTNGGAARISAVTPDIVQ